MNQILRLTIIPLILLSSTVSVGLPTSPSALGLTKSAEMAGKIDFGRHFQELGVEGSIIIYDLKNDRTFEHNPKRNLTAFLPASTFKILNSLIALETGVITDEIAILTWDGMERTLPEWNRDLNMKEAFKLSAVWFYQVLARRIGYEKMQKWVAKAGYGNQKIGSQHDIDKFWLDGEMAITPQEQIQFIRRLYNNDLPFSERSLAIVKDMMIREQTPDYTIRAKTGWLGFEDNVTPKIGWYVGYLERDKDVYFFATNIEIRNQKDPLARLELTRRCFQELGVL
jgi:beta-lactamase class D